MDGKIYSITDAMLTRLLTGSRRLSGILAHLRICGFLGFFVNFDKAGSPGFGSNIIAGYTGVSI